MKLKRPITRSCETKNPELEMKKALKLQGGRYKVQLKFGRCTLFSKFANFYEMRIFTDFPKIDIRSGYRNFTSVVNTHNSDTLFDLTKMSLFW